MAPGATSRRFMPTMPETVIARWQREAEIHQQASDYEWMAAFVAGQRVLEIGCGAGDATATLCSGRREVLSIEPSPECIKLAQARCTRAGFEARFIDATVADLSEAQFADLRRFSPEWIVCWLMGADDAQLATAALRSAKATGYSIRGESPYGANRAERRRRRHEAKVLLQRLRKAVRA